MRTRRFATTITCSRYHWRHTDLMDVLSGFQGRGRASLANMATLLGLPGKLGFDGRSGVGGLAGGPDLPASARYCETDVLNTWLIWLRFAQPARRAGSRAHDAEIERVSGYLRALAEPHLAEFLGPGTRCGLSRRAARPQAAERDRRGRRLDARRARASYTEARPSSCAGALPGERIRFRRTRRHRQHDEARLLEVLERLRSAGGAALRALWCLRRLRAAAPESRRAARAKEQQLRRDPAAPGAR